MNVVVFDIDGTLANIEHRRQHVATKPKNWPAFFKGMANDRPNWDVIELLKLYQQIYPIYLVSGRSEDHREVTMRWLYTEALLAHQIHYRDLFMRASKDYRADDIVKQEILDREFKARGMNVVVAVDDRDRVVQMWRRNGIRCLQVDNGAF